ncbi:MAG TPA: FAD-dependent oxidoreductase [Lentisphaeria bacterium]|nr:MAG: hypothetical protein A2X48_05040 [Lentisphaerae bacterium GWF2_49_21]HBC86062.1 FAD-dependent oxidoreductase [Lentisphaeria bacterium]
MMKNRLVEGQKNIDISDDSDVIVCGAGLAGVAAAVTAARAGAKTRLIEMRGCLGGVWTAGILAWVFEMDKPGFAMEIGKRLDARKARTGGDYYRYSYDIEEMKLLCENLCLDAGVKIRLHTRLAGASIEKGILNAVITESKSGREAWSAKTFIDCTGDGDLGAFAGCGFDMGGPKGEMQPWTFMGLIVVKDIEKVKDFIYHYKGKGPCRETQEGLKKELLSAGIETSYGHPTIFQVNGNLCALMVNHEYGVSAINADDLTRATISGRAELHKVVKGLRSLGGGWDGLLLAATAEQIGIREGRRIHGLYKLNRDDLTEGANFSDGTCTNTFNVDIHSPDPKKDKGLKTEKVKPYQIPYRSLVAKDVKGLLMAGRCISGDWIAHASYRVTGSAVALGEAAGAAAALSAKAKKLPEDLDWKEISKVLENVRR